MVSSTGTFVSCKDYDDDIDELTSRVDGVEGQIKDLEAKINAANWITSVTPATGGFTVVSMTVAATPLPTVRTVKQVLQVQNGLSRKMVFGYATVRRLPLKL